MRLAENRAEEAIILAFVLGRTNLLLFGRCRSSDSVTSAWWATADLGAEKLRFKLRDDGGLFLILLFQLSDLLVLFGD